MRMRELRQHINTIKVDMFLLFFPQIFLTSTHFFLIFFYKLKTSASKLETHRTLRSICVILKFDFNFFLNKHLVQETRGQQTKPLIFFSYFFLLNKYIYVKNKIFFKYLSQFFFLIKLTLINKN